MKNLFMSCRSPFKMYEMRKKRSLIKIDFNVIEHLSAAVLHDIVDCITESIDES